MANLASIAINKYPNIKKVILIDRPARLDKMAKISEISNNHLKEIIEKMNNEKIVIAHHDLHKQGLTKDEVFGDKDNRRNDGIHPNGIYGKKAIQTSFSNIMKKMLN